MCNGTATALRVEVLVADLLKHEGSNQELWEPEDGFVERGDVSESMLYEFRCPLKCSTRTFSSAM
jgi:hypothetical protein